MTRADSAATPAWPPQGRIAGIDYGTVRRRDRRDRPRATFRQPLGDLRATVSVADAEYFRRLVRDERIVGFVVGLPVFPSGDESPKSLEARRFGEWLAQVTERPVVFYDERYTTVVADEYLAQGRMTNKRRKERRDQLAAQVLLVSFLESGQRPTAQGEPLSDRE